MTRVQKQQTAVDRPPKEQLKQLEADLWSAADNLRANSDLTRVRAAIETVLDDKLPDTYDRAMFTAKYNSVFETMLNYASQGVKWAVAA